MKKIIVILIILIALVLANTLINQDSVNQNEASISLKDVIGINSLCEVEFNIDGNIINLEDKSCEEDDIKTRFHIKDLAFSADSNKTKLLIKFFQNEIKDIYELNDKNMDRLGFALKEKTNSIVINNKKTLFIGKVNQYNEIYILDINKIYKIDYYENLFSAFTKDWIDRTKPLLNISDSDEFDINIGFFDAKDLQKSIVKGTQVRENRCSFKHENIIFNSELLTLRNSFIDLYAVDKVSISAQDFNNISSDINTLEIGLDLKKLPDSRGSVFDYALWIWKKEHLVYMTFINVKDDIVNSEDVLRASIIPNAVYDNLNIDCKKIKSNLKNQ